MASWCYKVVPQPMTMGFRLQKPWQGFDKVTKNKGSRDNKQETTGITKKNQETNVNKA